MPIFTSTPKNAWRKHIRDVASSQTWMEDSTKISAQIGLSKRELFGLILFAYLKRHQHVGKAWLVRFDEAAPEPNDGFVTDGSTRILVEHKLIPQQAPQTPLEEILSTYEKYAGKGPSYGDNLTLLIYSNQSSQGMIKISDLHDQIRNKSPFDQVLLMHCTARPDNGTMAIMHVTQHYPSMAIAQIDFNLLTGTAVVPHCEIDAV